MSLVLNSLGVGGSETKTVKVTNVRACSGIDVEPACLNPPDTPLQKLDAAVQVNHLHRRGKCSIGALRRLRKLVNRDEQAVFAVNLNRCGEDMKVEFKMLDNIPLTESGKRRFIISHVSPYVVR